MKTALIIIAGGLFGVLVVMPVVQKVAPARVREFLFTSSVGA